MLKDWKQDQNKCILCGEESNYLPLCKDCYKNYVQLLKELDYTEELQECDEDIPTSLLQLTAYLDYLEEQELTNDNAGFMMNFIEHLRDFVFKKNKEIEKYKFEKEQLINEIKHSQKNISDSTNKTISNDPRKKHDNNRYRCTDGHYVRSQQEVIIDNWLYQNDIMHIYEKAIPVDKGKFILPDFYLKKYDLYIEHWGYKDDKYTSSKEYKTKIYNQRKLTIVSTTGEDIEHIDDVLLSKIKFAEKGKINE